MICFAQSHEVSILVEPPGVFAKKPRILPIGRELQKCLLQKAFFEDVDGSEINFGGIAMRVEAQIIPGYVALALQQFRTDEKTVARECRW